MTNRLKGVIKTMEIPFHTNSERGQRHRLMLTFIGPLLCNFNGGVTPCLKKKQSKLFSSELRQISTNCDIFWHKDGKETKII